MNGTYKITHKGLKKMSDGKSEWKEIVWFVRLSEDIPGVGKVSGDFCGKYSTVAHTDITSSIVQNNGIPAISKNSTMLIVEGQCAQRRQDHPDKKYYKFSLSCPVNGDIWEGQEILPGESEKMHIKMEKYEEIL